MDPANRPFLLNEALAHERTVQSLKKLFFSWGYLPVQTPLLDFYDTYKPFLDAAATEKIYRLIDREGDLLMLRSDVTLFLAKQLGQLQNRDLPLRIFYADNILRHEYAQLVSRNEFYQIGAELIGLCSHFADLEVLMLLVKCLAEAGLADYRIHLGSTAVFSSAFPKLGEEELSPALKAVSRRNANPVRDLVSRRGGSKNEADFFAELFLYIGDGEGLTGLLERGKSKSFVSADLEKSITSLLVMWDELVKLKVSGLFRFDLSETASQNYYTGMVFQAYKDGIDSAFAMGGRYDKLLARFGFEAPAAGFSLMLRKIERFLQPHTVDHVIEYAKGQSFAEAYKNAEKKRLEGLNVIIKEGKT